MILIYTYIYICVRFWVKRLPHAPQSTLAERLLCHSFRGLVVSADLRSALQLLVAWLLARALVDPVQVNHHLFCALVGPEQASHHHWISH